MIKQDFIKWMLFVIIVVVISILLFNLVQLSSHALLGCVALIGVQPAGVQPVGATGGAEIKTPADVKHVVIDGANLVHKLYKHTYGYPLALVGRSEIFNDTLEAALKLCSIYPTNVHFVLKNRDYISNSAYMKHITAMLERVVEWRNKKGPAVVQPVQPLQSPSQPQTMIRPVQPLQTLSILNYKKPARPLLQLVAQSVTQPISTMVNNIIDTINTVTSNTYSDKENKAPAVLSVYIAVGESKTDTAQNIAIRTKQDLHALQGRDDYTALYLADFALPSALLISDDKFNDADKFKNMEPFDVYKFTIEDKLVSHDKQQYDPLANQAITFINDITEQNRKAVAWFGDSSEIIFNGVNVVNFAIGPDIFEPTV